MRMSGPAGSGGARQGILSLAVKDKAALYNAYMPYIKYGGIFVPTPRRYFIGDEVFLLLTLPFVEELPVAGRVCWVTRNGEQGNRTAGSACSSRIRGRRCHQGRRDRAGWHSQRRAAHADDVIRATPRITSPKSAVQTSGPGPSFHTPRADAPPLT